MTTRVVVSIPYIHPGDEVVVAVLEDTNDDYISKEVLTDIIRSTGVKEYTIYSGKHLSIYERRRVNEDSSN